MKFLYVYLFIFLTYSFNYKKIYTFSKCDTAIHDFFIVIIIIRAM